MAYTDFDALNEEFHATDSKLLIFLKAMLHIEGRERKSAKELLRYEFIMGNVRIIQGLKREHQLQKQIVTQNTDMREMKELLMQTISDMKSQHQTEMRLMKQKLSEMESKHQSEINQLNDLKELEISNSQVQNGAAEMTVQRLSMMEQEFKKQSDKLQQLQSTQADVVEKLRQMSPSAMYQDFPTLLRQSSLQDWRVLHQIKWHFTVP